VVPFQRTCRKLKSSALTSWELSEILTWLTKNKAATAASVEVTATVADAEVAPMATTAVADAHPVEVATAATTTATAATATTIHPLRIPP